MLLHSCTQIIGPGNLNNIVRLQLAYMPPEISSIKVHRDMGGYALKAHRIHIPVFSNPKVTFEASGKELRHFCFISLPRPFLPKLQCCLRKYPVCHTSVACL